MAGGSGMEQNSMSSGNRILCVSTWPGAHELFYARGWCPFTCGGVCNNAAKRSGSVRGSRRVVACSLRAESKDRLWVKTGLYLILYLCHPVGQDNGQLCPWCKGWALSSSSVEKSNRVLSPPGSGHLHTPLWVLTDTSCCLWLLPMTPALYFVLMPNLLLCHSCCWEPRFGHVIMKTVMKKEIRVECCVVSSHAVVVLSHGGDLWMRVHSSAWFFPRAANSQVVCNFPCCLKQGSHVSAIHCQSAQRDDGRCCCYSSFINRLPSTIPSPTNIQYFIRLAR